MASFAINVNEIISRLVPILMRLRLCLSASPSGCVALQFSSSRKFWFIFNLTFPSEFLFFTASSFLSSVFYLFLSFFKDPFFPVESALMSVYCG
jgi:hypothetical protein